LLLRWPVSETHSSFLSSLCSFYLSLTHLLYQSYNCTIPSFLSSADRADTIAEIATKLAGGLTPVRASSPLSSPSSPSRPPQSILRSASRGALMRLKSRAINVRSLAHRDRKRDGSEHGSSSKNSSSSRGSEEEEEESEDEAEPSIRFFDRCAKGRGRFLYAVPMNKKVPPVRFLHEVERELLAMSNAVTAVAQRRRHNLEFRELKQRDHVMAVVAGNPRTLAMLRRFQIRYIFRYVEA
jgi:hypothetical protein